MFLLPVSCGYGFRGGGKLPADVKTITISVFENRTRETGIENTITNDIVFEFTRSDAVTVTDPETADAIFSGVVAGLVTYSVSRTNQVTATQQRVEVSLDVKMTSPKGKLLWSADGIRENESFNVGNSLIETEQNQRAAIEVLSKRLAQKVFYQLTEDF